MYAIGKSFFFRHLPITIPPLTDGSKIVVYKNTFYHGRFQWDKVYILLINIWKAKNIHVPELKRSYPFCLPVLMLSFHTFGLRIIIHICMRHFVTYFPFAPIHRQSFNSFTFFFNMTASYLFSYHIIFISLIFITNVWLGTRFLFVSFHWKNKHNHFNELNERMMIRNGMTVKKNGFLVVIGKTCIEHLPICRIWKNMWPSLCTYKYIHIFSEYSLSHI